MRSGNLVSFDDNVSRALSVSDKKADFFYGAAASAGQYLPLTDSASLALTGDFRSDVYTQYGGLNQYSLGATASLKEKFGLGVYAPWVSLSGSARHADYQSAIRDSWFYNVGITLGKRLSEKWDVQLEYSYLRRLADRTPATFEYDEKYFSGAVFDQANHGLKLSAAYSCDDKTSLTASYAFRSGDAFSTNSMTDAIGDIAKAAIPDRAFGANRIAWTVSPERFAAWRIYGAYLASENAGNRRLDPARRYPRRRRIESTVLGVDPQAGNPSAPGALSRTQRLSLTSARTGFGCLENRKLP